MSMWNIHGFFSHATLVLLVALKEEEAWDKGFSIFYAVILSYFLLCLLSSRGRD